MFITFARASTIACAALKSIETTSYEPPQPPNSGFVCAA
jgi:hypothetical protein